MIYKVIDIGFEGVRIDVAGKAGFGRAGFGILVYRSPNQKVIVNIIKESVNHSTLIEHRIGTSSKVKTNLRLFDNIRKTHPIYRKLFPNGRKHILIENS